MIVLISFGVFGICMLMVFVVNVFGKFYVVLIILVLCLFVFYLFCLWFGVYFYGIEGFFIGVLVGNIIVGWVVWFVY